MKVVVQLSAQDEAKALAILLRHSPGVVLPNRTYIIESEAALALRKAGLRFAELSREPDSLQPEGEVVGERI